MPHGYTGYYFIRSDKDIKRRIMDSQSQEKMRINIILPGSGTTGGTIVVWNYVREFRKRGIDVIVYAPLIAYNLHRADMIHNVGKQVKASGRAIRDRKKYQEIEWVPLICDLMIRDADYTIATAWPTAYDVSRLSDRKGKKIYFIQGYEVWDDEKRGKQSYLLPLHKIVISSWIRDQIREHVGPMKMPVVYNGMDSDFFRNEERCYDKKGEPLTVLMLNHSLKNKGVEYGLQAWQMVKKNYPELKLVMFGQLSRKNLPEEIEYHESPSQEEIRDLYCNADIFLFPSLAEGWGLTPLEAMACRCPVAGTRTGFVLDIGKDYENMLISEPGDIEGLAENLEKLVSDGELRKTLGENGRKLVQQLSWERSADLLLKCMRGKEKRA